MGFRNLRAFNEALLAKQGWRLITHPSSLVAQVLKAKYYPNAQFLQAKPKQHMSYSWRSILQASWVLKKG
ncbi:ribonuclease H protein, partial [Trifolium medium]|nr:ribonuclease H protein [Trifolium medium]